MACRLRWPNTPLLIRDALSRRTRGTVRESSDIFAFGRVGEGILTVRFTYRSRIIRIIGAGYWRKGKAIYERENQVHE